MSFVQSLKALADVKRMKILQMLLNSDLCVGALANHLGVSKPAVSQHLQVLRKAGLVKGEKRGYWTHYAVDKQALIRIAEDLHQMAVEDKRRESICRRILQAPEHPQNSEEVGCVKTAAGNPKN
jgi:DNA-binding transcriptional ArsR family regulator